MRKPLYNECRCPWLCVRVRDAAAMMINKQSCLLAESVSMATHHISRQRGSAWTSFQCHQLQRPSHFLRRRRPNQTHRRHRLRSEPASKGCPLWVGTCTWNTAGVNTGAHVAHIGAGPTYPVRVKNTSVAISAKNGPSHVCNKEHVRQRQQHTCTHHTCVPVCTSAQSRRGRQ